jgi:hypothetical protein
MPRFSRSLAVLLLVLLFLPAALLAAEPHTSVASNLTAWSVLTQVWSFLTGTQGDNGCRIDPNGLCKPGQSAAVTTDNGCRIEPNGLCKPDQSTAVTADNGCWLDPSGRCRD